MISSHFSYTGEEKSIDNLFTQIWKDRLTESPTSLFTKCINAHIPEGSPGSNTFDFSSQELTSICGLQINCHDLTLIKIKTFYLNKNKIKEVCEHDLKNLCALHTLDLSNNEIKSIDLESFSGLPSDAHIDLRNNYLSTQNINDLVERYPNMTIEYDCLIKGSEDT